VQGVGYPNPNRSHFRATEIWQTASDADKNEAYGWLGRYCDAACSGEDAGAGIAIGDQVPQALRSESGQSIAIGAPLVEELIFRGQLFAALSQTRLGVSGTSVVTSAGWALLHASEPWLSIGLIFIMGLAFGWMMYRFGSLWVPVICHGAWNGIYALIVFGGQGAAL
jgi:hypothetical protein